jgi:hypothetical protein
MLKMAGFASGTNMTDIYETILPSRRAFQLLGPHFDQQVQQNENL